MSRELVVEVIDLKRRLYQEQHDLHLQELAIEEEFRFAGEEQQFEKEKRLLELESQKLQNQLKIKRAHFFGLHLAKGSDPSCIDCFVDNGSLPQMVGMEPRILGTSLFRCVKCGHEIKMEP